MWDWIDLIMKKLRKNRDGFVLALAMFLLAILTVLGVGALFITSTELKISGNLRTATDALYVAEGGMEVTEGNLKSSAVSNFAGTSATTKNTQIYVVGDSPKNTITNFLNWVDSSWYIDAAKTTPLSEANAENATTLYKTIIIGSEYADITLPRPQWLWVNPTVIAFRNVRSTFSGTNAKKVEADIEIKFENNLLSFQTFKDPSDGTSDIDNIANNNVIIGGVGNDLGIDAALNKITGICTNDNTTKAIIIYKDGDNNLATSDWQIVGEPEINTTNKTFCLSNTRGWRYKVYAGGSGEEPECVLSGGNYVPDTSGAPALSISNGEIYKVVLVDVNSLSRSAGNPSGSSAGLWVSNSYDKW
ncbi:MAG: hypothetical protein D6734_10550 [Candidatus Schekmanbacteria bacterium]|nr:MAG: hypothetical protein D6734_10550 [Candidatus Schekmanbacteria bacterium]